jgi:hypothetical protein
MPLVSSLPRYPSDTQPDDQDSLTDFIVNIDNVPQSLVTDISVKEIFLTESLLTPSLQTTLVVHDQIHTFPVKILDMYGMKEMTIHAQRDILERFGYNSVFQSSEPIYRVSERRPIGLNVEQYEINCCDESLLINAVKRLSKSWKCKTPSDIVRDILTKCIGTNKVDIENSQPSRTYFADNIHPFQAIAQQADVALANGNDPSFLHYMTYSNNGTHHFRSLFNLTRAEPVFDFIYTDRGAGLGYADPHLILTYEFPCDFDILSDVLNGVGLNGEDLTSSAFINTANGIRSLLGNQSLDCGMGSAVFNEAFTNKLSGPQVGECETGVEKYLSKRQARLGLLDQDKIALRLTIPFNPNLHAGNMIRVAFHTRTEISPALVVDYGSGDYLISTMTHNLKAGGFGITILDCVSKTVGNGIV